MSDTEKLYGLGNKKLLHDYSAHYDEYRGWQYDYDVVKKWEKSFGPTFNVRLLPAIYLVRPKGGPAFVEWIERFELCRIHETFSERRIALMALIRQYAEPFKGVNDDTHDQVHEMLVLAAMETIRD